jgi:hypothetical protein
LAESLIRVRVYLFWRFELPLNLHDLNEFLKYDPDAAFFFRSMCTVLIIITDYGYLSGAFSFPEWRAISEEISRQ